MSTFYKYMDNRDNTVFDAISRSGVSLDYSNAKLKTTIASALYSDINCTKYIQNIKADTVCSIKSIHTISTNANDADGNPYSYIVARVDIGNNKCGYIIIGYSKTRTLAVELGSVDSVPTWLTTGSNLNTNASSKDVSYHLVSDGTQNQSAVINNPTTSGNPNIDSSNGTANSTEAMEAAMVNENLAGKFYPTNWRERESSQYVSDFVNLINSVYPDNYTTTGVGLDLSQLRGIFGMPYQFLPSTDCRLNFEGMTSIDEDQSLGKFGITYSEMIGSRMPLLYITPGNPTFLSNSNTGRTSLIADFVNWFGTKDENSLNNLIEGYAGKLYSIEPSYAEYFRYVNVMTRAGAINLGLNDGTPYSKLHGVDLVNYNWATNYGEDYKSTEESTDDNWGYNSDNPFVLSKSISQFQKFMYYKSCIPFYINSEVSYQETLNNDTTETSLASTINGLSDKAREMQFLLGTSSGVLLEAFEGASGPISQAKQNVMDMVNKLGDVTGNIFGTLVNSVKTVVSGGRIIFPNIWSNSTFSKQYSVTIKLTTPDFDKRSWYLNIYVPLCHLLALVLPRGSFPNGYTAPFLVKAFYKGMFNIDMGIITDMTINKGKEGGWTKDALPTVVEVNFTIQDLYSNLSMTSDSDMYKMMTLQNISEMDYLANLCGINLYQPDTFRMLEYWYTFNIENKFIDIPANILNKVENGISNTLSNMYNRFWV